jgi:hypothetical protein
VSGYERVFQLFSGSTPANDTWIATASCPAGKRVLAGGFVLESYPAGYVPAIMGSYPQDDATWRISLKNTTGVFTSLTFYVAITCAAAP